MALASDPPDLSRRERRKLEVRNRILDAAVVLFDRRGFAETKVSAICERADVAHKTFFNHFPSKQQLMEAIAQDAIDELLVQLEEARKTAGGTRERLLHFFDTIATNLESAGPMHRELVTEMVHVAHETGSEPEQQRRIHDAFRELVRDGRAARDVRTDHTVETETDLVLGSFYVLMFNWANFEEYPLRRHARATARLLADALCRAKRSRS